MSLETHLKTGITTVSRCWVVRRSDGVVLGFTDHDVGLTFGGISFAASSGMTARALQQSTGLSVDNSEAAGALSSDAITEADIRAGRYDDAEVEAWQVNWADVSQRVLVFRGTLGEITRVDGAFRAELRGLAEALNTPQSTLYQRQCRAVLGDGSCRFATDKPGFSEDADVVSAGSNRTIVVKLTGSYAESWFTKGVLSVLSGEAKGLRETIEVDVRDGPRRQVTLRQSLRADIAAGDRVRLVAGCDKTADSCREKFNNFKNFRGFPHIPGDDWLLSYPVRGGANDGGALR